MRSGVNDNERREAKGMDAKERLIRDEDLRGMDADILFSRFTTLWVCRVFGSLCRLLIFYEHCLD